MKANIISELLKDALNKLQSIVDKKNVKPILSYLLIEAKGNRLYISATDLEVSAKIVINTNVEKEGIFCVNAKNIFDAIKDLPNDIVHLEVNESENLLKIKCNKIKFSLLISNNEEFPHLNFYNESVRFALSPKELLELINKTNHAISNDETRIFLNGIFLQEVDSKLRAVATDGYRLALAETQLNSNPIETLINGIIIPKKGVQEIKKICESIESGDINISLDESFIYVENPEKYFLSVRLIAKEYLKYQAVIPKKTVYSAELEKEQLANAVKRIKVMANERTNGIKVQLTNGEMTISSRHPSIGDAFESIPVKYEGKEIEIGINAKYLLDLLAVLDDGEIFFEFNNELSPMIFKSPRATNFLGIVMPLKV